MFKIGDKVIIKGSTGIIYTVTKVDPIWDVYALGDHNNFFFSMYGADLLPVNKIPDIEPLTKRVGHKFDINPICECGSDAVNSPMHSDYCPKASTNAVQQTTTRETYEI